YIYTPAMTAKRVRQLAATIKPNKNHKEHLKIKYQLTNQEKLIVSILKPTEIIRDQRKYANQVGAYTLCRFWDEAVRRSYLPMRLAVRAFWIEYSDLIYQPQVIKKILIKRNKATVVTVGDNVMYLAGHRVKERQSLNKSQNSFTGTPACHGKVRGRARIILGPSDFKKFKNGEILVTDMTRPDFLPIIRHAKAIVTNEGGLMSHAAIVARELNIPCVLGTKVATRILKNSDLVEVDANQGIVKRVSKI
ncbi:MAG TPA: PEP-utilizing enzyme, partial [Bacilli bacterium]|nr:PEP-utilizing enzyme [Bacilli bacterium]